MIRDAISCPCKTCKESENQLDLRKVQEPATRLFNSSDLLSSDSEILRGWLLKTKRTRLCNKFLTERCWQQNARITQRSSSLLARDIPNML